MARSVLEQLSDFRDYTGGKELRELFKVIGSLSNVRVSPDARHIHVVLRAPKLGLVTFDKHERPQLATNQKKLDLARPVPVVDVLYLGRNKPSSSSGDTAAVIYEDGRAEFWRFNEGKGGWHLLQTSDLCNSPRARVVSVCTCSTFILWCEERPPSESSPSHGSTRNKLRYCVCRRDFDVEEAAVSLGGVRMVLHNNPKFIVVGSGDCVHLLPDLKVKPVLSISKFLLSWWPRRDCLTISTTCKNTPLKKISAKESDFKKLVTDCLGYLSTLDPPEIYDFSSTSCGGLLLLLSTGWVCLLQKDGSLRQVYKLADNCFVKYGTENSLCMYQDTLVLLTGGNLRLIDLNCGLELEKMALKRDGVLFVNQADTGTPHLLSETGLFVVANKETNSRDCSSIRPGARLVEAVFEEACKYYQQRSLSSTQLTVDALKKGGRFQAPISLACILRNYLSAGSGKTGAEPSQNGGGEFATDKLMVSLEAELKALVSLEEVKGRLVQGDVQEVEAVCEGLIEKEVARLLSSSELDKDALLHLNSIFSIFPCQMWRAAQAALQLHYNGEGSLSSRAPPDVWRTVLSPSLTPGSPPSLSVTNGRSPHSHRSVPKSDHNANCNGKPAGSASPPPLPVFELLCHSVFHFQPSGLPRFLELAQQQQQGSAGLGLSLASSSWSFSAERGGRGEGGKNNPPLYKRALSVLSSLSSDREQHQNLEVELLLVSGRPNAILQALRILMAKQRWEQVTQVAHKFSKHSPLLNKEIFTTLLCEVSQHRDLDPYLDMLWALCPEDLTVTSILNLVLKNIPSPRTAPSPSSFSLLSASSPAPFADSLSSQPTIGLLKPLLRKVLQRETKPSQRYADILQSPTYPPPPPPRKPTEQPMAVVVGCDPVLESSTPAVVLRLPESPDQQASTHTTA